MGLNEPLSPIVHKCPSCNVTTECSVAPRVHAWETKLAEMHKAICGDPFAQDPDGLVHKVRNHDHDIVKLKKAAAQYALDKAKATGFVAAVGSVFGLAGAWLGKKIGL